jgi:WD40 repeat protein
MFVRRVLLGFIVVLSSPRTAKGDTLLLSVNPPSTTCYIYHGIEAPDQGFSTEEQTVTYVITAQNLTGEELQIDWVWKEYSWQTRGKVTIGGGSRFIPPYGRENYYLRVSCSPTEIGSTITTTMIAWGFGMACSLGAVVVHTTVDEIYYPAESLFTVEGTVKDRRTGLPLEADIYAYAPTKYYVYKTTGGDGSFTLYLPKHEHIIQVMKPGYYTLYQTIDFSRSPPLILELEPIMDTLGSTDPLWMFPPQNQEPLMGWLMGAAASPSWDAFVLVVSLDDSINRYGKVYYLNSSGICEWEDSLPFEHLRCADFSNGEEIAVAGDRVYLYNRAGNIIWDAHAGLARAVKIFENFVVVGGEDGIVKNYSLADGSLLWEYDAREGFIRDIAVTGDGSRIIAGTQSGKVVVLNSYTGNLIFSYWARNNAFAVDVARETGEIGIGSWDGAYHYLDPNGNQLWEYQTNCTVRSSAVSPDGRWTAFTSRGIYLLNRMGEIIWHSEQEISNNWSGISADGRYFFFPGGMGTPAFLFNAEGTNLMIPQILPGEAGIWEVLISQDASKLAIPDRNGRFYVYDGVLGRAVRELEYTLIPKDGDTVSTEITSIRVSFNKPVFPIGNPDSIYILVEGDTLRPFSELGPWQIDINVEGILEDNKTYLIFIPGGIVQDMDNNLNPQIQWVFTTISTGIIERGSFQRREFELAKNYPNPFNTLTCIKYLLPKRSYVELKIYNIQGQIVKTLVREIKEPGIYSIYWNGRDFNGRLLPNGIYLYELSIPGKERKVRKMILMK